MLQLLQNLASGETLVAGVPAPQVVRGTLLIATRASLVSAGTERMLVDFGRAGWFDKARQQPEKVREVLDKVRTDGLFATLEAVRSKHDQPLALGYCNAGVVLEVGAGVEGFAVGDRVVSNGPHEEIVRVGKNLCARIPEGVSDEAAAFAVPGAIGLQGIRLVAPTLGECFVVTGLGLIELLTVQLLCSHGCRVLGIDFDAGKLALAQRFGAEVCDLARGIAVSGSRGVDGVIVTAVTQSSEPIAQAARMSRKSGRIVLVGVTGLELNRADFYEKELTFQVSCSYGPGRYDPAYEQQGYDYPLGFVRWTEQRNFEAVLAMLAEGKLEVAPLVSHRFAVHDAARAYEMLVTAASISGVHHGRKTGFAYASTDVETDVFANPRANAIVIATRHDTHARYATQALHAGKHVFVEKPIALTLEELAQIEQAHAAAAARLLMVGFNRRFAPLVMRMEALLDSVAAPKAMVYTVNAGAIPAGHWTQSPETGGGRTVGEACHFIDLLCFLAGASIESHTVVPMRAQPPDTVAIGLRFADGSVGTVHYFANGHKALPKERLEVFAGGRVLQLDNFRSLRNNRWPGLGRAWLWRQDKGQQACIAVEEAVCNGCA